MLMAPPVSYHFCPTCGGSLALRGLKPGEPDRLVCQACSFVFYQNPKLAACAITTVGDRVVLLRRAIEPQRGKWVFPGGFVDRGETVAAAAVRETREEICLAVEVEDLVGVFSYPGNDVVVVVYAARLVSGQPAVGDECLEVRTFAPDEIPWDELAFPSTREALALYLSRFRAASVESAG
jgi:ADP-ribose pyrophosphatase YjhB (NUDIX family)